MYLLLLVARLYYSSDVNTINLVQHIGTFMDDSMNNIIKTTKTHYIFDLGFPCFFFGQGYYIFIN